MAEAPVARERPPSLIPVPVNKRNSLSLSSTLQPPTNLTSSTSSNPRSSSPIALASAPPGRKTPVERRRQSLLGSSISRRTSFTEGTSDDPVQLRAQIALLQSALQASHQRNLSLRQEPGSAGSASETLPRSLSPRPWTPVNGLMDAHASDVATPMTDIGRVLEEDITGEGEKDSGHEPHKSLIPRLPHSSSSYDLRSSAATPAKNGPPTIRKISDGPLGLSRIPQGNVAHALLLHTDSPTSSPSGIPRPINQSQGLHSPTRSPAAADPAFLQSPFLGPDSPFSSSARSEGRLSPVPRKISGGSAASTRVIDALQTELLNAKGHNEKLKQEVRGNGRLIGSLTRQTEDLKETKERMRMECEGLNNVIARKERLLQEVLERARTAESQLAQHLASKKALEQSTKKSIQQMSTQVAEAQMAQGKAEREMNSLRDSVKSLKDSWTREMKAVRDEVKKAEDKGRRDIESARDNHIQLVKLVQSQSAERANIQSLASGSLDNSRKANKMFEDHIADLQLQLGRSEEDSKQAKATAMELAGELAHLRHLMRAPRRGSLDDAAGETQMASEKSVKAKTLTT